MKKNQTFVWVLVLLAVGQLGFDWGTQPAGKKAAPVNTNSKNESIPFPQMMGALSQNMTLWPALSPDNKRKSVEAAILFFQDRQNAAILRPVDFYVVQIDRGLSSNPALQGTDLMSLLKMMAVMEYDFYNGQNKDALAKEVLGEKMYQSIRAHRRQAHLA